MLDLLKRGGWKTYLSGILLLLIGVNWLLPTLGQKALLTDSALQGLLTLAAGLGVIGLAHKGEKLLTALREGAEAVVAVRTGQDTARQVAEALAALGDLLSSLNTTADASLREQEKQTNVLEGSQVVLEQQVNRQDAALAKMETP